MPKVINHHNRNVICTHMYMYTHTHTYIYMYHKDPWWFKEDKVIFNWRGEKGFLMQMVAFRMWFEGGLKWSLSQDIAEAAIWTWTTCLVERMQLAVVKQGVVGLVSKVVCRAHRDVWLKRKTRVSALSPGMPGWIFLNLLGTEWGLVWWVVF